ncbi:MAG: hypothetical protein IPP79_12980 [Chitinophagaceae bacterium]|nr:hypothetical protein [Chitinophagaceae bacterium]
MFRDNNQKPSNSTQIKIEASTSYTANSTDKLYYDNFEFTVSNNDADFKSLISTTTNYFPKDTIYLKAFIVNNSIKPLSTIALTVQTPAGVFVRDTILSINTYDTVERMIAIPGNYGEDGWIRQEPGLIVRETIILQTIIPWQLSGLTLSLIHSIILKEWRNGFVCQ